MSHWGGRGVRKVQKKCHVLFEWPLMAITLFRKKLDNFIVQVGFFFGKSCFTSFLPRFLDTENKPRITEYFRAKF